MAGNFSSGLMAGLEMRRYREAEPDREQARELRKQQIEENRLGLELARKRQADDEARRKLIEDATTEPVVMDFDASMNPQTVQRRPRQLSRDEMLDLHERLGAHDLATGRMSTDQSLTMRDKVRGMESEGAFDAYDEYRRTGDVKAATRMFNRRGKTRIDESKPITAQKMKDPITGMEYEAYTALTPEGQQMTFDPLQAARETSGARGWLDRQKTSFEAQRAKREDRKMDTLERREAVRELENARRQARDDDRYFLESRRLDIMEKDRGKDGGSQGGVFGYKMRWLADNMPDLTSEQRYQLATGQRTVPEAQIAKWAEDAVGRAEKLTGIPMKPEERKKAVKEKADFLRGMRGTGGAEPGGGAAAKPAATRDYSNLWNNPGK